MQEYFLLEAWCVVKAAVHYVDIVVIAGAIVAELPAGPAGPPSKHK
jgi:hypothetical protein